jgi:hypothetical protein
MKINYNKINELTGAGIMRPASTLLYMRNLLDYLYKHNKNYTKQQYYKIEELKIIVDNMEG